MKLISVINEKWMPKESITNKEDITPEEPINEEPKGDEENGEKDS